MNAIFQFCLGICLLWLSGLSGVQSTVTPFLQQSFFFDWNIQGQPLPIPVTAQCDIIHIVWSRSTATGPNPTAPYYLQVYTSAYTVPFIIPVGNVLSYDWAVPFYPGTLYQICMFDKFGNTGGCQATYTVIPPSSSPTCANVTFAPQLGVTALVDNGPMSQYGWIDQCTDISLIPTNGTGPYTLTVAPALHPPYNITSPDARPINWTLSLDWASPFFISLVDSTGSTWANGPLHAGGGGTIACLAGNSTSVSTAEVKLPITIGSGIGGLVIGALLGTLGAYLLLRRQFKRKLEASRFVDLPSGSNTPHALMFENGSGPGYRALPTVSSSGAVNQRSNPSSNRPDHVSSHYQVEPFTMPDEEGRIDHEARSPTSAYIPTAPGRQASVVSSAPQAASSAGGQVYVVHHDSNTAPVTIYHQEGTKIVELPPSYPLYSSSQSEALSEGRSVSDSRSDGSRSGAQRGFGLELHQVRQPNQGRKPPQP